LRVYITRTMKTFKFYGIRRRFVGPVGLFRGTQEVLWGYGSRVWELHDKDEEGR